MLLLLLLLKEKLAILFGGMDGWFRCSCRDGWDGVVGSGSLLLGRRSGLSGLDVLSESLVLSVDLVLRKRREEEEEKGGGRERSGLGRRGRGGRERERLGSRGRVWEVEMSWMVQGLEKGYMCM